MGISKEPADSIKLGGMEAWQLTAQWSNRSVDRLDEDTLAMDL